MKVAEKLVPELRFSGFVEPYTIKRIDALLNKCSNSVTVKETHEYQQIGIRSHGKGIFHKSFVTGADLGNKRVFWVKENTFILNIVFAWEQAVAKTSLFEKGMIASHRFPMYNPVKGLTDIDYILYFFLTQKGKHLLGIASPGGAGRNKTLGQKTFEDLKISIPTLPEQQKIASFLSTVDKKIKKLTRKKELLEKYKKGVMQKIFSREIRFKDENGKDYPDWEEKRLGDIAENIGYGMNSAACEYDGENKYIRITDIDDKSRKLISTSLTSPMGKLDSNYLVREGDLLFARTGASVGKSYLHDETDGNHFFAGFLIRFSINGANPYFVFLQTLSIKYQRWVKIFSMRSGQPGINAEELKSYKVGLPIRKEQQKIANFLSTIDKKIQAVQTQLNQTQKFKKGLLQKMFV